MNAEMAQTCPQQQRAYRYRFYPAPDQATTLARTFGCTRYVFNWALQLRQEAYQGRQASLSYQDTSAALTGLKQQPDTTWLSDVSSVPLQQALRHLDSAFRNFFAKRAKYPHFKKKRARQAATYASSAFRFDPATRRLTLAKMDEPLDIRWSRPLPAGVLPTTVTVSQDTAGRYFVSLLAEEVMAPPPVVEGAVGLDLGLLDVVAFNTGEKVGNPISSARTRQNWPERSGGWPRNSGTPRIARKPAGRWRGFMPTLPTVAVTSCTNSRPASSVRTKRSASRVWS